MSLYLFVSLCVFLIPADAGVVGEGEVWYYRHSMVWLSRLGFQLIPGNAASHEDTMEPNHDAANFRLWREGRMDGVRAWRDCGHA